MNIVVQTSFVGDAILTLPFLWKLLQVDPAPLVLVVAPRNEAIFRLAFERGLKSFAARVSIVVWDKAQRHRGVWRMRELAQEVRRLCPETPRNVFCLQRSFRTGLFAWCLSSQNRVGFASGAASFFYTHNVARSWDVGVHEVEKNFSLLSALYGEEAGHWNREDTPSFLSRQGHDPRSKEGLVVSLSLGSPWATKQWDLDEAYRLCERLLSVGVSVRLLGDRSSVPLYDRIRQGLSSVLLEDFSGRTNLRTWVDLLENSDLVVSGDSAAVHVASDLNRPVVALFGPTVPEFGFAPWRKGSVALGVTLPCRPCHIHGPQVCPLRHHHCMKLLTADKVFQQVSTILSL